MPPEGRRSRRRRRRRAPKAVWTRTISRRSFCARSRCAARLQTRCRRTPALADFQRFLLYVIQLSLPLPLFSLSNLSFSSLSSVRLKFRPFPPVPRPLFPLPLSPQAVPMIEPVFICI